MPAPPLPTNLLLTQNLCGNPKWEVAARRADERSLLIIASPAQGVSKCFLGKAPVGLCPLANLETAHCTCRFLTERGHYRARRWLAVGKSEGLLKSKVQRKKSPPYSRPRVPKKRRSIILGWFEGRANAFLIYKIPYCRRLLGGAVLLSGERRQQD